VASRPTVVDEPEDSDDEIIAFDDIEPEDPSVAGEATPAQAVDLLQTALAGEGGREPPQPALAEAAGRLRQHLESGAKPYRYVRRAAGWGDGLPSGDAELVVGATAALMSPREPSGLAPGDEDLLAAVEAADWLGAVVGVVRGGDGTAATPSALVQAIAACPEVDSPPVAEEGSAAGSDRVEAAFEVVLPAWEAAGVVDGDWRLTPLGRWALPRALARAWAADFDGPSPLGPKE
jgi:hypothetical protein